MDKMFARDLRVRCVIGTKPEERKRKQTVRIGVEIECDLAPAGRSDRLEDTVNYKRLARDIVALAAGSRFFLIERLAEAVADLCLRDARIRAVTVNIRKPEALTLTREVGVEIRREARRRKG
jgi:FolB domain-containing protein